MVDLRKKLVISGILTSIFVPLAMSAYGLAVTESNKPISKQLLQISLLFFWVLIPFVARLWLMKTTRKTTFSMVVSTMFLWIIITILGVGETPDAKIGLGMAVLASPILVFFMSWSIEHLLHSRGK